MKTYLINFHALFFYRLSLKYRNESTGQERFEFEMREMVVEDSSPNSKSFVVCSISSLGISIYHLPFPEKGPEISQIFFLNTHYKNSN